MNSITMFPCRATSKYDFCLGQFSPSAVEDPISEHPNFLVRKIFALNRKVDALSCQLKICQNDLTPYYERTLNGRIRLQDIQEALDL